MSLTSLLLQLYIEGLCHGNLLEEEALNISKIFRSNFSVQALPFEMRHKEYVMCLPTAADLVRDVRVKNKLETNSVVEVIKNDSLYIPSEILQVGFGEGGVYTTLPYLFDKGLHPYLIKDEGR